MATVFTGRGQYLYYHAPSGVKTSASRLAKGIDIRADGGQAVLPPSRHARGVLYRWEPSPLALPPVPLTLWISRRLAEIEAPTLNEKMALARQRKALLIKLMTPSPASPSPLVVTPSPAGVTVARQPTVSASLVTPSPVPASAFVLGLLLAGLPAARHAITAAPALATLLALVPRPLWISVEAGRGRDAHQRDENGAGASAVSPPVGRYEGPGARGKALPIKIMAVASPVARQ